MKSEKLTIPVENDEKVSAVICTPDTFVSDKSVGVIIAHGAANDMNEPLIVKVCEGIVQEGHVALRFNFIYREKGLKAVDPQNKLENTWKHVHQFFTALPYNFNAVVISGKSLGGRVASQMLASGKLSAQGLILLGYPLHPPGKKDFLRDAHLYEIKTPMLFFAGTRDTLCDLSLLDGVLKQLKARWELMVIEGGDHSFHLPKAKSEGQEDLYHNVVKKCNSWIKSVF
ncbi:MAG: alpha/beta family hydrolase [Desulfobacterales bacterium]